MVVFFWFGEALEYWTDLTSQKSKRRTGGLHRRTAFARKQLSANFGRLHRWTALAGKQRSADEGNRTGGRTSGDGSPRAIS
ncbi:unnamed protein product [Cuscuta campestris]|uniref:Uncharacterized protein n=1 Tax=Cuscuta campestris TaxID=132261 RepID=A0A484MJY6_9ASTE|nr:unnamed protein product [Cuscuta campestris]